MLSSIKTKKSQLDIQKPNFETKKSDKAFFTNHFELFFKMKNDNFCVIYCTIVSNSLIVEILIDQKTLWRFIVI